MDSLLTANCRPTAAYPLRGTTVLVVEDSRFACDAIRLMCQKSGARVRRADSLEHGRRHLRVYRPTVAIIDLGLPDGVGEDLIRELAKGSPRIDAILGMSGDPFAGDRAIKAGADGFISKPIHSIAEFQSALIAVLPTERSPVGPRAADTTPIEPDPLALRDDLRHAAEVLSNGDISEQYYVAQFVSGLARSSDDPDLLAAAEALTEGGKNTSANLRILSSLIEDRIGAASVI